MIEINLLPEDLRKKVKKKELPKLSFLPIAVSVVLAFLFIQIILGLSVGFKHRSINGMKKELERLSDQKRQYNELKATIDELNLKSSSIDKLMAKRLRWAKKLNELSNSVIPGIWLTKLSLDEVKEAAKPTASTDILQERPRPQAKPQPKKQPLAYLTIEGFASSMFGEETATIGKFIKSLKDNKDFFDVFTDIKLDSIQRQKIENTDVMNFRILCYFKKSPTEE